ncbi:MAG: hypothetical protein JXQ29_16735 [Planctomycetes bacterium]|nr:hypothetical protein [Planctomycetota bacterium]
MLKLGWRPAIIAPVLVWGALAGCASRWTESTLPDHDRAAVFRAARAVLGGRFPGFQVLDEKQGLLVTDPHVPAVPPASARFHARVELAPAGRGTQLRVQVVQEALAFRDLQMVWLEAERTEKIKAVEGYILEEIRARLEGREPDLPDPAELPATPP